MKDSAIDHAATAHSAGMPLAPIQQGFLAEGLVSEDKGVNVEQIVGEFSEPLDEQAFEAAWQHALDSFDAFRVRLSWPEGAPPEQHVVPGLRIPFTVLDIDAEQAPNAALEHFLKQDRERGFDLYQAPLLRVSVLRFPGSGWAFVCTVHHSIIDGGVYARVIRFVFSAYDRIRRGETPEASTAPDYLRFIEWLGGYDARPGVEHFRSLLSGVEELTELPLQYRAGAQASKQVRELCIELSSDQTAGVIAASKEAGATPNTLIQLGWGLLLGRLTGVDDVVFGTTWSGRPGTIDGAKDVVGPFITTLPTRVNLSHGPTVREALVALREQHIQLRPYQHTPLSEIKAGSELASAAQLFNTLVVFEYERFFSVLEREQERFQPGKLWSRSQTSYPLGLSAYVVADSLRLIIDYDTGLYSEAAASLLAETARQVMIALSENLDKSVHQISLLKPQAQSQIVDAQLAREQVAPEPSALSRVFEAAERRAEATAIEEVAGGSISYRTLRERARQLGRLLVLRGVQPGDIIGIMMSRSIEALVSMLAVHVAGAAFVPLDPANPDERLEYMIEDSQARVVLVNARTRGKLPSITSLELDVSDLEPCHAELPNEPTLANRLAYVIYTSGSTGKPKGVCISHAALANHVAATLKLFELTEQDRVLQFAALSFDASLEEIFPTLAAGATLVVRSDDMTQSARNFFDGVRDKRISVLDLPTAFWHQMIYAELDWPERVRLVVIGGERASAPAHAKFRAARTGHLRLLNTYGPTETTVTSTAYDDREGDHDAEELPIGKAAHGLSHFVLDKHLQPVVPTSVGQLYIGGVGLAIGYLRREELTREKFVDHPFRSGARLYATGDLVRETPNGNLIYVDRVDNQVKIRGFRIELGEIEARLRSHAAVEEAVVVVQKTPGQDARLAAFVVADAGEVSGKQLRQHLSAALPPYMVPAHVSVEKDLPKTPAGKVDRRKLATREVLQEAPDIENVTDDELERQLLAIWSELLKVPVTDTSQSFFELGGNSLVAVQMFTLVEKRLGRTCKVTEFFKNPTVVALRQLIDSHDGTDWKAPRLELAKGRPGALPMFLAPSVTGRAIDYVHLGEALGKEHPVYALQIKGLREGEALHPDLASAAAYYADLMQEVQPKGPYAVIGFSAGGIIAMAIAEVLHDRGEKMAFLGVLDSVPPVPSKSPFTSPTRFKRLVRTTVGRVRELAQAPNALQHLVARTKSALKRGAAIWLPVPLEYEAKVEGLFVGANVELSEAETLMMQTHLNTIMAHTPRMYPIDLVLFRTHLDPFEGPHEPDLAWSRAVRGKIAIATLPCMHHELLTRDGAPRLANLMQPYLARLPKLEA